MSRSVAGVRRRMDGSLERRFSVEGRRYSVYGHSMAELCRKEQRLRVRIELGSVGKNEARLCNGTKVVNLPGFGEKDGGVPGYASPPQTLNDYFEIFIARKRLAVKSNTVRSYISFYKPNAAPDIGRERLSGLSRVRLLEFRRSLCQKLKPATINNTIKIIRLVLAEAVRDGVINKNPEATDPQKPYGSQQSFPDHGSLLSCYATDQAP